MTFATDDTESDDILKRGHENYIAAKAIRAGLDPVDAIKIATIMRPVRQGSRGLEQLRRDMPLMCCYLMI